MRLLTQIGPRSVLATERDRKALPGARAQRRPGGGEGADMAWRGSWLGGPGRRWNALWALPMFRGLKWPLLHGGAGPGVGITTWGKAAAGLSSRFEGWGQGNPRQAAARLEAGIPSWPVGAVLQTVCCERW